MPFEIMTVGGKPVKMWLPEGHEVEAAARQQLGRVSRLSFVTHVACMPDVHVGIGATVGSVIATERAIIPAAVGVDIGCGMIAVRTTLRDMDLPDSTKEIRLRIESFVPHGFQTSQSSGYAKGTWDRMPGGHSHLWKEKLADRYERIVEKHPQLASRNAGKQVGTLGGGNHFIELCLDEESRVWIMLHSGSRNAGNEIGKYFIEMAREDMRVHHINLEDRDLAYLSEGTEHFADYTEAVLWAQDYAKWNREAMLNATIQAMRETLSPFTLEELQAVNCHHNYVAKENHGGKNVWVTRKGAVRAREGDLGIIPGNMGNRSYIVRGKGNPESLDSCSHGAGRVMSRSKAKQVFTIEDLVEQTAGVECRKDAGVIDEIPGCYKNIDAVINIQKEHGLLEVLYTLKQFLCVKG